MPPKELKEKPATTSKPSKAKAKAEEKKVAKQTKQVKTAEKGKLSHCWDTCRHLNLTRRLYIAFPLSESNINVATTKVEKTPAVVVPAKDPKKRVKKDKDAPKKPMSPFFCY